MVNTVDWQGEYNVVKALAVRVVASSGNETLARSIADTHGFYEGTVSLCHEAEMRQVGPFIILLRMYAKWLYMLIHLRCSPGPRPRPRSPDRRGRITLFQTPSSSLLYRVWYHQRCPSPIHNALLPRALQTRVLIVLAISRIWL